MTKPITLGVAFALTAFAVSAPAASSKITSITSKNIGDGVEIAIKGESLKKPKTFFFRDGQSFVVDFNAKLTTSPSRTKVRRSGIDYFNYAQYKPTTARIHIQVDKGVKPTVVEENGTWYIRVGTTGTSAEVLSEDDIAMAKAMADLNSGDFDSTANVTTAKTAVDVSNKTQFPPQQKSTVRPPASTLMKNVKIKNVSDAIEANSLARDLEGQTISAGTIVGLGKKDGYADDQPDLIIPSPKIPVVESPFQEVRVTIKSGDSDVRALLDILAVEAGVNIMTGPGVSPADDPALMSLKLTDVSLDFAMNAITAMNDLRYARIDNTFVVTKSSNFHFVMRNIMKRNDDYETRVVQISSGEAAQIRDAAIMAIPQDGPGGYYELIDPTSDDYGTNSAAVVSGAAGDVGSAGAAIGGAIGGAGVDAGSPATSGTPKRQRARYVMLVGESDRLDSIEAYVRDLDARISDSLTLSVADVATVVVPIYSGQTENITTTLNKLIEDNPRAMDYSIQESSVKELAEGEESIKVVIIAGPAKDIDKLEGFATSMDETLCMIGDIDRPEGPGGFEKFYEVVDLKFIEPMLAEFDLKNRVRGLYVTILPDPVTPGMVGKDDNTKQDKPVDEGDGATTSATDDLERTVGHEQMRLVLRGTRTQIDKAKDYLLAVDIPARQVAIELRVMELTKEEALKVGLDWSILSGTGGAVRFNQTLGGTASTAGNASGNIGNIFQSGYSGSVLATLDELANERNLIARPNALITDGRGTRLFVGDTIRYVKTITASQNGTSVEIDEVDVGVTVNIMARIGADGNIAFTLDQNFSILNGFTPVPGGGQIPQTSDRETTMFVNMSSGETVALGGLILDQDRKSVSGIPFLKDLPIIGHLFKRTNNTRVRTELVFFLTAVEVTKDTRANAAAPKTALENNADPQKEYFGGRGKGGN